MCECVDMVVLVVWVLCDNFGVLYYVDYGFDDVLCIEWLVWVGVCVLVLFVVYLWC